MAADARCRLRALQKSLVGENYEENANVPVWAVLASGGANLKKACLETAANWSLFRDAGATLQVPPNLLKDAEFILCRFLCALLRNHSSPLTGLVAELQSGLLDCPLAHQACCVSPRDNTLVPAVEGYLLACAASKVIVTSFGDIERSESLATFVSCGGRVGIPHTLRKQCEEVIPEQFWMSLASQLELTITKLNAFPTLTTSRILSRAIVSLLLPDDPLQHSSHTSFGMLLDEAKGAIANSLFEDLKLLFVNWNVLDEEHTSDRRSIVEIVLRMVTSICEVVVIDSDSTGSWLTERFACFAALSAYLSSTRVARELRTADHVIAGFHAAVAQRIGALQYSDQNPPTPRQWPSHDRPSDCSKDVDRVLDRFDLLSSTSFGNAPNTIDEGFVFEDDCADDLPIDSKFVGAAEETWRKLTTVRSRTCPKLAANYLRPTSASSQPDLRDCEHLVFGKAQKHTIPFPEMMLERVVIDRAIAASRCAVPPPPPRLSEYGSLASKKDYGVRRRSMAQRNNVTHLRGKWQDILNSLKQSKPIQLRPVIRPKLDHFPSPRDPLTTCSTNAQLQSEIACVDYTDIDQRTGAYVGHGTGTLVDSNATRILVELRRSDVVPARGIGELAKHQAAAVERLRAVTGRLMRDAENANQKFIIPRRPASAKRLTAAPSMSRSSHAGVAYDNTYPAKNDLGSQRYANCLCFANADPKSEGPSTNLIASPSVIASGMVRSITVLLPNPANQKTPKQQAPDTELGEKNSQRVLRTDTRGGVERRFAAANFTATTSGKCIVDVFPRSTESRPMQLKRMRNHFMQ